MIIYMKSKQKTTLKIIGLESRKRLKSTKPQIEIQKSQIT